jgi:modulator of FtsH protease
LEGWSDFFIAATGASAALSGTLLVAISINLDRILAQPTLPTRAGNTLAIVGSGLVVAGFNLMPWTSPVVLGCFALAIGGLLLVSGSMVTWAVLTHPDPALSSSRRLTGLVGPAVAVVPYVVGGVLLLGGDPAGPYWVGCGIVVSFVVALQNSWVLLVEILR